MYVTLSSSQNLVQDLSEMQQAGKTPAVYFTLFENQKDIAVLCEALKVLNLEIAGCLLDEMLLKVRHVSMREKIRNFSVKSGYTVCSLRDIKMADTPVIVVKNDIHYFHKVIDYFKRNEVTCCLSHYSYIKDSAIVNGTERVINRIGYLNSWPWFLDILNKDMPLETRAGFHSNQVSGRVISNGEYYHNADIATQYSEIKDGFRAVSGYKAIENQRKYTVTMIGDSRFVNSFVPTDLTVASYLQKYLTGLKLNCEVKNLSVRANEIQNEFAMLKSLNVGESDVILCSTCPVGTYYDYPAKDLETLRKVRVRIMHDMTEYCHARGAEIYFVYHPYIKDIPNLTKLEQYIADSYGIAYDPDKRHEKMKQLCMACGVNVIDLTEIMINNKRTSFFVDYSHFSPEGSACIAKTLGEYVRCYIEKEALLDDMRITELTEKAYAVHKKYVVESRFKGLNEYLEKMKKLSVNKPENCGAIVMNCNPFTLGHRYLIETASKQVEHLYILAVEEDRSVFKFNDRIEMMRRGTADLPNVEVIPSGKFVISSLTFPEYFEKSEKPDATVDTSTDLEIFARYIAPALKVKTRFVGEEPIDMVTNQYNRSMEEHLPKYGIRLVEIPRKESGNAVISASRVRKLLGEKKYDEVKEIVPSTTFDYLIHVLGY